MNILSCVNYSDQDGRNGRHTICPRGGEKKERIMVAPLASRPAWHSAKSSLEAHLHRGGGEKIKEGRDTHSISSASHAGTNFPRAIASSPCVRERGKKLSVDASG